MAIKITTPIPNRPDIVEINGAVRIEPGHVRRRAVATEELLSNQRTASHYHAPIVTKDANPETGEVTEVVTYAKDAKGKEIKLGEEFDYIDYKSDEQQFNVYVWRDDGKGTMRWMPDIPAAPSYEAAMEAAVNAALEIEVKAKSPEPAPKKRK